MKKWVGHVYLLFAFLLAGTSVISARLVSGKLGTFTIASTSLFFALLFLLPACGKKLMKNLHMMSVKDILLLIAQAACGIFLFRMFLLYGMLFTSSMEAGILTGTTPAFTALFAAVLLKEPVSGQKLTGMICTVGGILLIQGLLHAGYGFTLEHLGGNLLVLCAAACESTFNIISRVFVVKIQSSKKEAIHPLVQTTLVSAMAFILCLVPAFFEAPLQKLSEIGLKEWLSLFWYGLFVTALAFVFWYAGIKRCGAFTAAAFSGMMPFTSMILSVLILGEYFGWQQWLGGGLVISGMILIGTGSTPAKVFQFKEVKSIKGQEVK